MIHKQITAAFIGAGLRSQIYLEYALLNPQRMKIVSIVEPNDFRREKIAKRYSVQSEFQFTNWDDFFAQEKIADVVVIGTMDHMHYEPAISAIEKGYHILIEKPIAQTIDEILDILNKAEAKGLVAGTCHVLRYHPYFMKIKELVASKRIGNIINIKHDEFIGMERMTHSYVRGKWNKKNINPLILSKSCHDIDFIMWLLECDCKALSSFGSLKWFRAKNAPEGSSERCIDCNIEKSCIYSSVELYIRKKRWTKGFDIENDYETLINILKTQDYGICVYRCNNDVVDHQVLIMKMDGDILVTINLNGITKHSGRATHIIGSKGEIIGDGEKLIHNNYETLEQETYDFSNLESLPFHAGADLALVEDFLNAIEHVEKGVPYDFKASIKNSIISHTIALSAENSRIENRTIVFPQ